MTQDLELNRMNGDEKLTKVTAGIEESEELTAPTNGTQRQLSISRARIERMRVANVKTAVTLFVVSVIFIIAFLPAWLMAVKALRMNIVIFNLYFIYNVVNPFIYAFLNQNFKAELRHILHCRKK